MKTILKYISISVLLIVILAVAAYFYAMNSIAPVDEKPFYHNVTIPPGTSVNGIAGILYDNKIIRNKTAFMIMIKLLDGESSLKAGDYVISSHLSTEEIIKKIISGDTKNFTVTIPEGFTLPEIKKRLLSYNIIKEKEFDEAVKKLDISKLLPAGLDTIEGALFPDTYIFPVSVKPDSIIKAMIKQFKQKLPPENELKEYEKKLQFTFKEILIVASLVEKEARHDEDRAKIASVFYNRLRKKMRLESCATIQYILADNRKQRLFRSDLQVESPYNTYKHEGLPPTPIANPSQKSINAALNPENTDYLFFVAQPDGYHIFSKTFLEHNNAIKKIKKLDIKGQGLKNIPQD